MTAVGAPGWGVPSPEPLYDGIASSRTWGEDKWPSQQLLLAHCVEDPG